MSKEIGYLQHIVLNTIVNLLQFKELYLSNIEHNINIYIYLTYFFWFWVSANCLEHKKSIKASNTYSNEKQKEQWKQKTSGSIQYIRFIWLEMLYTRKLPFEVDLIVPNPCVINHSRNVWITRWIIVRCAIKIIWLGKSFFVLFQFDFSNRENSPFACLVLIVRFAAWFTQRLVAIVCHKSPTNLWHPRIITVSVVVVAPTAAAADCLWGRESTSISLIARREINNAARTRWRLKS